MEGHKTFIVYLTYVHICLNCKYNIGYVWVPSKQHTTLPPPSLEENSLAINGSAIKEVV